MKKILIALLLLSSTVPAISQGKTLTMEEAMLRARTTLAPDNLAQLQFYMNSNDYVYLKNNVWMRGNYGSKSDTAFLTLDKLNELLQQNGFEAVKSMPAIRFSPAGWMMTINGSKVIVYPIVRGMGTVVVPKELASKENVEESSSTGRSRFIAYLENYNLFVQYQPDPQKAGLFAPGDMTPVQVTKDGSKDIVYASSVHREEFGISKGIFWSNSGDQLAFYRMDQSMVKDYPIIDWSTRPAHVELIKYPMAGDQSHHVTVGVYNANNKTTVWLKTTGDPEQYLTNIAWSPDDKYVFVAVLNRGQNHMWLNQYDAATGNFVKSLFEETDAKYTEPLVPMLFVKNNDAQFIWQSNRDGWNHLYLYDTSGRMIRQLTKGNWEVTDVKGFDPKGEKIFFVSTVVSPVDRSLSSVDIKTGTVSNIIAAPGVHNTQISPDGTSVLDVYSTINDPRVIELRKIMPAPAKKPGKGKQPAPIAPKLLLYAQNPLQSYLPVDLSLFTIKNNSGDSLYCRLFKPSGFDAAKKYPVIVYWYGGPHAQMILNSWNGGAGDYWFRYMAQRGYVVFTVDTRGSDNRGKTFEQSIFRKLGDAQMDDLQSAMDYLTAQSYVDKDRMGLFGWSFGGFMTTDFMLNHPSVFKAAVAGGPVMDWKYYEIMYGERYMDTPQENPEGYAATDLTKQVSKLKGKLLLIHGLQDPVVVQQHSINFVKACVDNGIQIDYMLYPGHEHNVLGKDRAHLYQKVTDYLMQYLDK